MNESWARQLQALKSGGLKRFCGASLAAFAAIAPSVSHGAEVAQVRERLDDFLSQTANRLFTSTGSNEADARLTAQRMQSNYGYRVTCMDGLVSGLSSLDCVIGMRKIFDALQAKKLPSNPTVLGATELIIGNQYGASSSSWSELSIEVPYWASIDSIYQHIRFQLESADRVDRRKQIMAVQNQLTELQKRSPFEIQSVRLSPEGVSRGLTLLQESEQPLVAAIEARKDLPSVDAVVLGRQNLPLYESKMRLKIGLDVTQTSEAARRFMAEQAQALSAVGSSKTWIQVNQFMVERKAFMDEVKALKAKFPNLNVRCGSAEELAASVCRKGVSNLAVALALPEDPSRIRVDQVVVLQDSWDRLSSDAKLSTRNGQVELTVYDTSRPKDIAAALIR